MASSSSVSPASRSFELAKSRDYRRLIFWIFLATIAGASAYVGLRLTGPASEMASGTFSGAVIGGIIMLYEQFREERRLENEIQRDDRLQRNIHRDKIQQDLVFRIAFELNEAVMGYLDELPAAFLSHSTGLAWKQLGSEMRAVRFLLNQVDSSQVASDYRELSLTLRALHVAVYQANRSDASPEGNASVVELRRQVADESKAVLAAMDVLVESSGHLLKRSVDTI